MPVPQIGLAEFVAAQPDTRPALRASAVCWTYADLRSHADEWGTVLRSTQARPGELLGVLFERSPEAVAALLAVVANGCAYLPLAPRDAPERLAALLTQAGVARVLTTPELGARLPEHVQILALGRALHAPARAGRVCPPGTLAVLFTSGSTGRPKGVLVRERSVVNLVACGRFARFAGEVFLHAAPLSFDASFLEVWGVLASGGTMALADPGPLGARELRALVDRHGVTSAWLTAGLFDVLARPRAEALSGLRQVLTGGDVVPPAAARALLAASPDVRLVNGYGPTECTTFACCHMVQARDLDASALPIGQPIENVSVYLTAPDGSLVAAGEAGEICIAGEGVSAGYLERSQAAPERFVDVDFGQGQERVYRTGDLALWREDGVLEFRGRADRQVKVRGFRVEPAEVEALLERSPLIERAVIEVLGEAPHRSLVAFCRLRDPAARPADLREALEGQVPQWMQPARLEVLDDFPLLPSGKLDRAALRARLAPQGAGTGGHGPDILTAMSAEQPADDLGAFLASAFGALLSGPAAAPDQDFFRAGGDSLRAVALMTAIDERLGLALPVTLLYECGTPARLARALRERSSDAWPSLVPLRAEGRRPPLFIVHGLSGDVFGFQALARALGPEQPLLALRGLKPEGSADFSVASAAAHYLHDVRRVQPCGPYRLAGYSAGGCVAFEMARRLREAGEEVAFLGLLDAQAPGALSVAASVGATTPGEDGLRQIDDLRERLPRRRYVVLREAFMLNMLAAVLDYAPTPADVRIHLLRTRPSPRPAGFDPRLGWGALALRGVNVNVIPGAHLTVLREPYVRRVAWVLARALAQVARRGAQHKPLPRG